MRPFNINFALLLTLALCMIACSPAEVIIPDGDTTALQSPASSMELPATEAGSAQVSLADSTQERDGRQGTHHRTHGSRCN